MERHAEASRKRLWLVVAMGDGATDLEGLRDLKRATPLAARSDPMTGMAPARGFLALPGYGPVPRLGICKLIGLRWA